MEFPDGISHGIIDCNYKHGAKQDANRSSNTKEPKALTYFRKLLENNISPIIEFACLTHPHLDHYRGYGVLLNDLMKLGIPINQFWDFGVSAKKARAIMRLANIPEFKEQKDEIVRLLEARFALIQQGIEHRILVNPTKSFWKKNGIEIDLLAPHANQFEVYSNYLACETTEQKQAYRRYFRERRCLTDKKRTCRCPDNDNVISSALLVKYGNFRLLLAGDITNCSWRGILGRSHIVDPSCHCIKVSHHGSIDGNFPYEKERLWDRIRFSQRKMVAAISGGYRPNLPHEKTVSSLKLAEYDIYCTGPKISANLRPYTPSVECEPLAQIILEKTCFIEDTKERDNNHQQKTEGDGDITVQCYANGHWKVLTRLLELA